MSQNVLSETVVVDWQILAYAIRHYSEDRGYKYTEVPWIVTNDSLMVTCPSEEFAVFAATTENTLGALVGSAEQGFLQLDLAGQLGKGKFVSCSPCFRNEEEDRLHQKTFMKIELYQNDPVDTDALRNMMGDADAFFRRNLPPDFWDKMVWEKMGDDAYDLMLDGIEIGSYGIRCHGSHCWVFGTGVALPRFSIARGF